MANKLSIESFVKYVNEEPVIEACKNQVDYIKTDDIAKEGIFYKFSKEYKEKVAQVKAEFNKELDADYKKAKANFDSVVNAYKSKYKNAIKRVETNVHGNGKTDFEVIIDYKPYSANEDPGDAFDKRSKQEKDLFRKEISKWYTIDIPDGDSSNNPNPWISLTIKLKGNEVNKELERRIKQIKK